VAAATALGATGAAFGNVFSYEATLFPEQAGWTISQNFCNPMLWLDAGWFYQHVELCDGYPPPGGQTASYRRSLADFDGAPTFFVEFRMMTDAPRSEIPWGGGAALAVANDVGVRYTFFIARDQAKMNRDNALPIVFVDLAPGPHTHRLELVGAQSYTWFVDGLVIDSGIPEGVLTTQNPRITWLAKAAWVANTTKWDYIRYGTIPRDGSGDYDSNGVVDATDVYFFLDCLLGPDANGPGCRWADMNSDGKVNGDDIQPFAAALVGP